MMKNSLMFEELIKAKKLNTLISLNRFDFPTKLALNKFLKIIKF